MKQYNADIPAMPDRNSKKLTSLRKTLLAMNELR